MNSHGRETTKGDITVAIAPATGSDAEEGYRWKWIVLCGRERRSGACRTRDEAEREAAAVVELLRGSEA
ncbi:MAG: hypothetical protein QOD44_2826 [Solirubrobacteraceae bacterium]|jgi:hypothetical protein|nr:hypothetical protein [Solirubrobacteraceae bacterium]